MHRSPFIRFRPPVAALSLVLLPCACDDGASRSPERSGSAFSVRDSAGVEIVQNGREAVEQAPALGLAEALRIGVLEGPEEYQFAGISAVKEASDGSILVLDSRLHTLRVFTASGEFVRQIGREGDGPGEFRFPSLLAIAGDTAVVGNYERITFFVNGEHSVTQTDADAASVVSGIDHTPRGWFAAMQQVPYLAAGAPSRGGPLVDTLRVGPMDVDSREPRLHSTTLSLAAAEMVLVGSMGWVLSPVFSRPLQHAIATDGRIYFTPGDDYVIDVVDASGNHIRRIVADVEKIPVTRGDVDAFIDRRREAMTSSPSSETATWLDEVPRAYRTDVPLLPYRPIPGRILASPGGHFLVERVDLGPAPEEPWEGDAVWDLFDRDGRIAGRLSIPQNIWLLELTDDVLWTVTSDELDVQHVVSYRIERADARADAGAREAPARLCSEIRGLICPPVEAPA